MVRLRLGNIVPADTRLIRGDYLLTDESALTGESLPVEKHQSDDAYSSSIVKQGEMDAVVTATGMKTFFGKTTALVEEARTKSHFQKAVVKIGDYLIVIAAVVVTVTSLVEFFRGQSLPEILQFGLVLTVAAIPAALPAVMSVSMAVGSEALAKKEAIVSKLVAIEEMAGVDILCADKTGTITKNELTVGDVVTLDGHTESEVLTSAALASREEDNDPIDGAVIAKFKAATDRAGVAVDVVSFTPFDPVSKRTEAVVESKDGTRARVSKGAPQAILALVGGGGAVEAEVGAAVERFATKGYRALGVGMTDAQQRWSYLGLIALNDPPREDSAATIAAAESMGIDVKMVTGDHVAIAKEIAARVGLGTNITTASSIMGKSDSEAEEHRREGRRVRRGLSGAQVPHSRPATEEGAHRLHDGGRGERRPGAEEGRRGIAVAGATDAAKSAAAVVLTKPGLSVIIDAVKESRKIFQRMTNYAIYRINETIRVLVFVTLSILAFQFYPVTALMIVLLALLNDMPIMTIAYDNVQYSERPERWNMRTLLTISTFLGAIGVVSSFGLLYIGLEVLHLSPDVLQSFIYLKLSVAGHLALFVARTKGPFWSIRPAKPLLPRGGVDAGHRDDPHRLRHPAARDGLELGCARLGVRVRSVLRAGLPQSPLLQVAQPRGRDEQAIGQPRYLR